MLSNHFSITGALTSALASALSWLCCLPIAFGVLGTSSALFAGIAPVRPYLMGLSLMFLGVAFYQIYRHGRGNCSEDQACAAGGLQKWQKLLVWLAAALSVGLLTVGYWAAWVIYWML